MKIVDIAEAISDMIENRIYGDWKHEGYINYINSDVVSAQIDGVNYEIMIEEEKS